jgi:hypothetical protein
LHTAHEFLALQGLMTMTSTMNPNEPSILGDSGSVRTLFIACAALGREVKAIINKHGWDADFEAINAKLHLYPAKIGPAVEERLREARGKYERTVVVYGHCGAFDLDEILKRYGAVRPLGPHCYEMYGGEQFAEALHEEVGTFILTDFLVHAWKQFVEKGLKIDKHPKLRKLLFAHYKRILYFSQERDDEELIRRAREIADSVGLSLEVKHVGYGDLERRLVAIMEDRDQPIASMTLDGYSAMAYPVASPDR